MKNCISYVQKELIEKIPFFNIILPYTEDFTDELSKKSISQKLVNKLHLKLLIKLSDLSEAVLHYELRNFNNRGQKNYQDYLEFIKPQLKNKYPVLDNILKTTVNNFLSHIKNIFSSFRKDINLISETFDLKINKNDKIEDIETGLGDGHNGEGTALIKLSNNIKIIYKPRNVEITQAYNSFIKWTNEKLNVNLKTFRCLNCKNYGWLEFVKHSEVETTEELKEYYFKAGILLAVALVLGSKDCHYENVIASGGDPVLIDHETIIQPILSGQLVDSWEEKNKLPLYSVLESILIVNQATGVQLEYAGFGVKGEVMAPTIENKILNSNTPHSQRKTHLIYKKRFKDNIPLYKNEYAFASDYKEHFIKGFCTAYDLLRSSVVELTSCANSPISFFKNMEVRYVWRPTFIYYKIYKYMNNPVFMSDFNVYKNKLSDLMSIAYKRDQFKKYNFILESEIEQMLDGNIPYFSTNSLNYSFKENQLYNIFEFNCVENIVHRLNFLSETHKQKQIEHIARWLQVNQLN